MEIVYRGLCLINKAGNQGTYHEYVFANNLDEAEEKIEKRLMRVKCTSLLEVEEFTVGGRRLTSVPE